ncbi:MAG: cell division protein FtsA, partial [Ktedonobacterales bacterium]|nr:cell division protein FtsA [Ktedonobacterales bacterium]
MRDTLFTGVDIGSTKIAVVVGQLDRERHLHIQAATQEPTQGIRRGGITDIDEVANGITRALDRAAHLTGARSMRAFCSISGAHIQSQNHRGAVAIAPSNRDIDGDDITHVLDVAGSVPLEANRMVLAVLPRTYLVDGQDGIKNPAGMAGYRLEAEAHIVTGAHSAYRNLLKCAERARLEVEDVVVAPLAAAEAVLAPGERDGATALIDLGGGT